MGETEPTIPPDGRVLPFRRRPAEPDPTPVAGLDKFQQAEVEDDDDYRHRMLVNVAAFVLVATLVGAGYWIADTMARHRKDQDCVLSGRPGCTPVEYVRERR